MLSPLSHIEVRVRTSCAEQNVRTRPALLAGAVRVPACTGVAAFDLVASSRLRCAWRLRHAAEDVAAIPVATVREVARLSFSTLAWVSAARQHSLLQGTGGHCGKLVHQRNGRDRHVIPLVS